MSCVHLEGLTTLERMMGATPTFRGDALAQPLVSHCAVPCVPRRVCTGRATCLALVGRGAYGCTTAVRRAQAVLVHSISYACGMLSSAVRTEVFSPRPQEHVCVLAHV